LFGIFPREKPFEINFEASKSSSLSFSLYVKSVGEGSDVKSYLSRYETASSRKR